MGVFILALTVLTSSHLWSNVQASSQVLLNAGIRVARGQSVFITANELQFHTDHKSEACKVEVVLNEPITQRVGKLTPQVRKNNPGLVRYHLLCNKTMNKMFFRFSTASSFQMR